MRFFNIDSPLIQKLSLFFDLMVLNVLTIVCSLPIITMGASISALYDSVWKLKQNEGTLIRNYFQAFRKNFTQATFLFIPLLLLSLILVYNTLLLLVSDTSQELDAYLPFILSFVIWNGIASWVFPLHTRFINSTGRIYANALLCAFRFFPRTIAMVLINLVPWGILLLDPMLFIKLSPLWWLVWFGIAAYLNMYLLDKPLQYLTTLSVNNSKESKESDVM